MHGADARLHCAVCIRWHGNECRRGVYTPFCTFWLWAGRCDIEQPVAKSTLIIYMHNCLNLFWCVQICRAILIALSYIFLEWIALRGRNAENFAAAAQANGAAWQSVTWCYVALNSLPVCATLHEKIWDAAVGIFAWVAQRLLRISNVSNLQIGTKLGLACNKKSEPATQYQDKPDDATPRLAG